MHRYLLCRRCGGKYSAVPEYYQGRQGYLACCSLAVQLYQQNPTDHSNHLLADLVDVEFLQKAHADVYAVYPPLPSSARVQVPVCASGTITGGPPPFPAVLRRLHCASLNYGLLGLMMYQAGYKRYSTGVWRKEAHLCAELDYCSFQDGDRIELEPVATSPFDLVKTESIPGFYGIRYRDGVAA